MRIRVGRSVVAPLTLVSLCVACGGDDTATDDGPTTGVTPTSGVSTLPPRSSLDRAPDDLVLEVVVQEGFGPVAAMYHPLPRFALYGDGTLIGPAGVPEAFPPPLLPTVTVSRLDDTETSAVLEAVAASGLETADDVRFDELAEPVADAPNTVFTYVDADGAVHRMSVLALGVDGSRPPEVAALSGLLAELETLDGGDGPSPYDPTRYEVLIAASEGGEAADGARTEPWPLPVDAAEAQQVEPGLGCVVVDGIDADNLAGTLDDADTLTFFEHAGAVHRLTVRPLLPHEEGCPA
jgi:hypothetical protein